MDAVFNVDVTISVVVLTYNQEKTIVQTLNNILNQKHTYKYEVIIGEDSSLDGTRAICMEYVSRYPDIIKLMPAAPNKGVLKNYRDVLYACKGKYVFCCAGDDHWCNDTKISMQVDFMEANPEYGVTYTDYSLLYSNTGRVIKNCYQQWKLPFYEGFVYDNLIRGNFITAGTVAFQRDLFFRYVELDVFIKQGYLMEDYPTWLTLSQYTKFKFFPAATLMYRHAFGSLSNNKNWQKVDLFQKSVFRIKLDFLEKTPIASITKKQLSENYNRECFLSIFPHNKKEARKYINSFQSLTVNDTIKKFISIVIFSCSK